MLFILFHSSATYQILSVAREALTLGDRQSSPRVHRTCVWRIDTVTRFSCSPLSVAKKLMPLD
jgi:hypothetical protein